MHEQIHERVEVLTSFTKQSLKPLVMKWRNRKYYLKKVTLNYHSYDGRESIHYFSVADAGNYFKLAFYTKSMTWYLEEHYSDG